MGVSSAISSAHSRRISSNGITYKMVVTFLVETLAEIETGGNRDRLNRGARNDPALQPTEL